VTTVDWVIVAFTLLLAVQGYLRGFLVGVLALIGFAAGAWVGTRIAPLLLGRGSHSPYAPLFSLGGALLLGGVVASVLEGVGYSARAVVRIPLLRLADGLLGAVFTAAVGLGIAWIAGAVALQTMSSGSLRHEIEHSAILRELNEVLPPSGAILNALARIDPLPSVTGPAANVPAPTRGILATPGVRGAGRSVVRVIGTACGLGIEGSGWVAAPGLVVTNAHVVAGETDTVVQVGGVGPELRAIPVVFDPLNDIAVLRVPGLDEPALSMEQHPAAGTAAGILGYPEDGPYDPQAGRLGQTQNTETQNAYGDGPVLRLIASLRGLVRPGNSGGPMIDAGGKVVATVFAAITNPQPGQEGGFAVPDSIVAHELSVALRRHASVSTQGCAD
jgi:S1-C subfamily serine protease